jgi:uncharacterized membrane protein YccC
MQTLGPFGPLFAFRIGQPGISLGFFEGALAIATAAVMQTSIVPITGKLLDYSGLIMAFLFIVFAVIAYLLSNTRLFLILALVAVGTITTVYVGIFEPGQIGWGSTYTFDGILIATLVMVALDTSIWPSPPEPRLLESIAKDFERTRERLGLVGRRYLEPVAAPLPPPNVTSTLAPNLALLESIKEHMKPTPRRLTELLDSVVTAERIHLEVERIATLADEAQAGEIRQDYREEIETALEALDEALAEKVDDFLASLPDNSAEHVRALPRTIRHLNHLSTRISLAPHESTEAEFSRLLGFVGGLETIANLLEPRNRPSDSWIAEAPTAEYHSEPRQFIDLAKFRFSIKLGTAITLGLLVGLTTQRADLQTILWSVAVVGQPNQYGAIVRKTLLRLAGCVMGGLAALAAMILVSENFDSLPAYLAVIFAVTIFSTYVAQSDEWLGYAGIQTGITFLVCYVGIGPTTDVYKPLWRFWGIVLGVLTSAFVFLFLWPEYASDKLVESLDRLLRNAHAFGREVAEGRMTQERITAAERHFSVNLLQVLNMADQARLEGQRGVINSAAGIEAATTATRIAYRFEVIARERLSESEAFLPKTLLERSANIEEACCAALEYQLEKFGLSESFEQPGPPPTAPPEPPPDLKSMIEEFAAAATLESAHLPPDARSGVVAQLESYRRLLILLASLDAELSKIVAP